MNLQIFFPPERDTSLIRDEVSKHSYAIQGKGLLDYRRELV